MNETLLSGSLFSGVEGMGQGLEATGRFRVAWQAERDPYCLDVLNKHYPSVHKFEEVKYVTKETSAAVTGGRTIDVIFGGSPCQGLSVAGKRGGLRDSRSGQFYQFLRVINELKPLWFIWENVPGVLSSGPIDPITGKKRRGLDFAIALSGFAGGLLAIPGNGWKNAGVVNGNSYNIAWRVLDSRYWGVPQRRRRVYVVGGLRAAGLNPTEVLFEPSGYAWDTPPRRKARATAARTVEQDDRSHDKNPQKDQKPPPQDDSQSEDHQTRVNTYPKITGTLAASGAGTARIAGRQENEPDFVVIQNYRVTDNSRRVLADENTAPVMPLNNTNVIVETHRAYGFTGFVTDEAADTLKTTTGRQISNLVTYAVKIDNAQSNGLGVLDDGTTHTLGGAEDAIVYDYMARRLTERETERLQDWPDDWTAQGASGNKISATQRYKMTGNGVTSAVLKWIGERLYQAHVSQYLSKIQKP